MRKLTKLLPPAVQLRSFLLRCFSSTPSQIHRQCPQPYFLSPAHRSPPFSLSAFRPFSSDTKITPHLIPFQGNSEQDTALALSSELLKDQVLLLSQRLDLIFSHITLTPSLILETLNLSPDAGRSALDFHKWVSSRPNFKLTDESLSYFLDYFGRRKDFKVIHEVLVASQGVSGPKTFEASIDRLVRAGRPTPVVSFFVKMDKDYGFARNLDSLRLIVSKLCDHGYASYAEKMVKRLANEFFPDEC